MVGVRTPVLQAILERRLLIVYRLDPDAAMYLVPAPFSLQLVEGHAVGVLTADRVVGVRPRGFPVAVGFDAENAAHRIAVEWDQDGRAASGVFVLARHTSSAASSAFGDRFFPGGRVRADFQVDDAPDHLRVAFTGRDDACAVDVSVATTTELVASRLFPSTDEAWRFFRRGAVSYSLRRQAGLLDGVDIRIRGSDRPQPAAIEHAASSVFTPDFAVPDCALVMRDVPVEWHAIAPPR